MPLKNAARSAFFCAALLLLCACAPQRFDSGFLTMGTTAELSLLASDTEQAASFEQLVEQHLQQQARDWYAFGTDDQSELRRLNQALAQGQSFTVSDALFDLLTASMQFQQRSNGYFDPAVAPLTQAWGFADSDTPSDWKPPSEAALSAWRAHRPQISDLLVEGHTLSSARRDLQLDLGAIAKGYAMDQAIKLLQQQGCENVMLNLGGQVVVVGQRMATTVGAIALRSPRSAQPLADIVLRSGESISTSGDYERSRQQQGHHWHHLLDPHTGMPVMHTEAVTVIAQSATLADAASTALMAADPEQWQSIARQMGIREALRVDASGAIEVSTALYARLRWHSATPTHLTLVSL
jgi:FAD:protein FMN transferase